MNSLWDIRIFLGLVPKESHCMRYIIWVVRLFYGFNMFFISCLDWLFRLIVQRTEVGIPSSSCYRHHCCQIWLFFNLKCSIYVNSVICFANNLYVVITEKFCYKMCFFAAVGKGSPFISGTFFFDDTFNSLLSMKTFCAVWTDCSWNVGFLVDCPLLRGYLFFFFLSKCMGLMFIWLNRVHKILLVYTVKHNFRYVYEPARCTKFLWLDFIFY